MKNSRLSIFDTTLRDGEQSPNSTMTIEEKLRIAARLSEIGVDVIEAGFPAASNDDLVSVKRIAEKHPNIEIAALARVYKTGNSFPDIDSAYEALKEHRKPRLHLFIATSPQQISAKFPGKNIDDIVALAKEGIIYGASKFGKKVTIQFSPEDASRTSQGDLIRIAKEAVSAGAKVVNIPDTVGYATPSEFATHVKSVYDAVSAFRKGNAIISVHCHNDLGCATANALEAVIHGNARQIECALIGLGERAGMSSLEHVVMAVKTRKDIFGDALRHINTAVLYDACRELAAIVDADAGRYPVIGDNAFSHEAGIHQHGEIAGEINGIKAVYEIMDPKDVGWKGIKYHIGKHSGQHAVAYKLALLGYENIDETTVDRVCASIKVIADKKKYVYDNDIDEIMIEMGLAPMMEKYKILDWTFNSGRQKAKFAVKMSGPKVNSGKYFMCDGNGPVDAAIQAISSATGIKKEIAEYKLRGVTAGSDAEGRVSLIINDKGAQHSGTAVSTNIVAASAQAYVCAINRMQMYRALKKK